MHIDIPVTGSADLELEQVCHNVSVWFKIGCDFDEKVVRQWLLYMKEKSPMYRDLPICWEFAEVRNFIKAANLWE